MVLTAAEYKDILADIRNVRTKLTYEIRWLEGNEGAKAALDAEAGEEKLRVDLHCHREELEMFGLLSNLKDAELASPRDDYAVTGGLPNYGKLAAGYKKEHAEQVALIKEQEDNPVDAAAEAEANLSSSEEDAEDDVDQEIMDGGVDVSAEVVAAKKEEAKLQVYQKILGDKPTVDRAAALEKLKKNMVADLDADLKRRQRLVAYYTARIAHMEKLAARVAQAEIDFEGNIKTPPSEDEVEDFRVAFNTTKAAIEQKMEDSVSETKKLTPESVEILRRAEIIRTYVERGCYRCVATKYMKGEGGMDRKQWCEEMDSLFTKSNEEIEGWTNVKLLTTLQGHRRQLLNDEECAAYNFKPDLDGEYYRTGRLIIMERACAGSLSAGKDLVCELRKEEATVKNASSNSGFLQLRATCPPSVQACADACCPPPSLSNVNQPTGTLGFDSANTNNIHTMFTFMFFLLAMFLVSKVWRKMNKTQGKGRKNGESVGTPLASFSQL